MMNVKIKCVFWMSNRPEGSWVAFYVESYVRIYVRESRSHEFPTIYDYIKR